MDEIVYIEAELSSGSIQEWLSFVKDGNKTEKEIRRSDLSMKVKKHLSALGWSFYNFYKGTKRELRYKSPNGKRFNSLAKACEDELSRQEQNKKRTMTVAAFKSLTLSEDRVEKKKNNKDCDPDKNCDVCCVCHWGGGLLLCDGCPSAFHQTCLGLLRLPKEELWFCPCCCCDVCGSMNSSRNTKLMACKQCQRRFHLNCLKEEPCTVSGWFCSSQCSRVFSALQNLIGCKITVGEEDMFWTLIKAPNEDQHSDDEEQISKLDSAVEVLNHGFKPTKDGHFSGKDLVEEMIYKGLFYIVLIERNNQPITAAALRVDKDVAEIPLVATLPSYRRIEMCRMLMDELEKQMSKMGVCRLVLPAVEEAVTTWTQRFGFLVMESTERLELVKHGMFDFVGTVMCHKFLKK